MKNLFSKSMLIVAILLGTSITANAQATRNYIKNAINEWGQCRNVAITQTNGDIALYGANGWAMKGCPKELEEEFQKLNQAQVYIDDVQLTEQGRWVILYGDNGSIWHGVTKELEQNILAFNENNEIINTITFNDEGEWIIISNDYIKSSDENITTWLTNGNEQYGKLWTACMTDDGCVAVYENGYQFLGEVPESLKKALQKTKINVYRLKIAGDHWFFADKEGNYEGFM